MVIIFGEINMPTVGIMYIKLYLNLINTSQNMKKETTLSKHIWDLKDKNEPYTLTWDIISRAEPFSQVTGICQLCTREKFIIGYKSEICTLNTRNELLNSCRHKRAKLLVRPRRKLNPGQINPLITLTYYLFRELCVIFVQW